MSSSGGVKRIKERGVKWAQLRFTDTRGTEQHVTIPARYVTLGLTMQEVTPLRMTTHRVELDRYYSV